MLSFGENKLKHLILKSMCVWNQPLIHLFNTFDLNKQG